MTKGSRLKAAAIAAVMAITAASPAVLAEYIAPYYLLEGSYDESAREYTLDIKLYTDTVIDAGSFGLKFGEEIKDKTKTFDFDPSEVSMTFGYDENGVVWDEYFDAEDITDQLAFTWTSNDVFGSLPRSDTAYVMHLGTIKIEDVDYSQMFTNSFTVLDWNETAMASSGYINSEIWREGTAEERAKGIKGYYQGQKHVTTDESETWGWVDIGLYVEDDSLPPPPLPEEFTLNCSVEGYNPTIPFIIRLYGETADIGTDEPLYTFSSADYPEAVSHTSKGWCTWSAELGGIAVSDKYKVVVSKTSHLTYPVIDLDPTGLTDAHNASMDLGSIKLICGDVYADEIIDIFDRFELTRCMLSPHGVGADSVQRADLDGDGLISFVDLNSILYSNFGKSYSGTNDEAAEAAAETHMGGGST